MNFAAFTDLHGSIKTLRKIIKVISKKDVDAVVFTGDFVSPTYRLEAPLFKAGRKACLLNFSIPFLAIFIEAFKSLSMTEPHLGQ